MPQPSIVRNAAAPETFFREGCHITEWWNSPDDGGVSLARARVEPGVATRRHRLKGVIERYVILDGRGLVEAGGLAPAEVGPGDVVVVPAGTSQRIHNTGTSDLIFIAVCTPRFIPGVYEDIESEGDPL